VSLAWVAWSFVCSAACVHHGCAPCPQLRVLHVLRVSAAQSEHEPSPSPVSLVVHCTACMVCCTDGADESARCGSGIGQGVLRP
jgi:hypothetical protein